MPVTKVGLVSYADDPQQKVFRKVFPVDDDSELDDPRWITENVDPNRVAVLQKVLIEDDNAGLIGTP